MRPVVTLAAALLGLVSARADRCVSMLARIDAAAASTRLSPAQAAELDRLSDEGRALCDKGEDQQAVKRLAEVELILGLR